MNYIPLNKIYYSDPDNYEAEYQKRINASDTIRLGMSIHGHQVFIVQNVNMYQAIVEINRANFRILQHKTSLPGIALDHFEKRCLVDEIVITNSIEGVNSTRREILEVVAALSEQLARKKKPRFKGLVLQYAALIMGNSIDLSSCRSIRKLYDDLVLPEVIEEDPKDAPDGEIFRKEMVEVTNAAQKTIHQGVYPESEIISCMESALCFLNSDGIEPLIKISAFHYLFGYIHPFYDGNGRLSRFISSYLLSKELDPLIGYRLSYTIKENLNKYYDAFKVCNDPKSKGDITPFVCFFLDIILEAMQQLEYALKKRVADLKKYSAAIKQHPLLSEAKYSDLAIYLVQAALFAENGISTPELEALLGLSYSTLKKRLDAIDECGLLYSTQIGKWKYYKLNLDALEK